MLSKLAQQHPWQHPLSRTLPAKHVSQRLDVTGRCARCQAQLTWTTDRPGLVTEMGEGVCSLLPRHFSSDKYKRSQVGLTSGAAGCGAAPCGLPPQFPGAEGAEQAAAVPRGWDHEGASLRLLTCCGICPEHESLKAQSPGRSRVRWGALQGSRLMLLCCCPRRAWESMGQCARADTRKGAVLS